MTIKKHYSKKEIKKGKNKQIKKEKLKKHVNIHIYKINILHIR